MSRIITPIVLLILWGATAYAAVGQPRTKYLMELLFADDLCWVSPTEVRLAGDTAAALSPPAFPSEPGTRASDILVPVPRHLESPKYPEGARARGLEATLTIQSLIGGDGLVRRARIIRDSGHNCDLGFEFSALLAAMRCDYEPVTRNGQPVPVWVTFAVVFDLD